jgi:hypothetical protein
MTIWSILPSFGIFCGHLVYFSQFWSVLPRKIWQHCSEMVRQNTTSAPQPTAISHLKRGPQKVVEKSATNFGPSHKHTSFLHSLGFIIGILLLVASKQGDQIGPIFACWVIDSLGKIFENYRRSPNFWINFFNSKSYALIVTKMGWAAVWALFQKLMWSPCLKTCLCSLDCRSISIGRIPNFD